MRSSGAAAGRLTTSVLPFASSSWKAEHAAALAAQEQARQDKEDGSEMDTENLVPVRCSCLVFPPSR